MALIECRNLTKQYGSVLALNQVSLNIDPGRIVGLLGPNGSGKTTFIKLANGLLTPTMGSITIAGQQPGVETKKIVSYLPDREFLPRDMKIGNLIRMYQDFFPDFNAQKAVDMFRTLDFLPDQKIRHMSKGMLEKTQLVLCMSREAQVYFLDEPIGGVDPAMRDFILRTIITNYNPNAVVLISTHLIADIENVLDDVIFLKQGSVFLYDSAEHLRSVNGKSIDELFREVFRC